MSTDQEWCTELNILLNSVWTFVTENSGADALLIARFVESIAKYSKIDPEWLHIETKTASVGRNEMVAALQALTAKHRGHTLKPSQLDDVLEWVPEE